MATTANRALYRKYRPRTFAEVIGQEHVTAPLIQALKNGKLNHAYLFSGPRGCGKTSSARILARSLNCVNGPTPEPCGVCDSCVALAPDGPGSLDVVEIDAASHGGVDDARDLRERAFFAPVNSRFKVYVIDEAHMVSSQGFNALLKLVEEPPDFVKFVFATTEPDKVLQTIRSRTHHYPFRLIPPSTMVGLLDRICTDENVLIEKTVLPLVVRAGGGSARDSLSLLDQLLAGADEQGVTYQRAVALLGVTDSALLDEACDSLAAGDGAALFAVIDRVVEAGHDPRRFASDLLERLRDLVIIATVPDAASKGLVDAPSDQLDRMVQVANQLGIATASRMADVVHNGLVEMRGTTSPRLLLELVCARMLLPGADDSQAALLQRLERLERRFAIAPEGTLPPAPVAVRTSISTPSVAPPQTGTAPVVAPRPVAAEPVPIESPAAESEAADSGAADSGAAPSGAAESGPAESVGAPEAPRPTPAPATPPRPAATQAAPQPQVQVPAQTPTPVSRPPAPPTSAPPAPTAPAPTATAPAAPVTAAPGGGLDAAAIRQVWPQIVELTKSKRRALWALVQDAIPREVRGDELILAVKHQGLVRRLNDDELIRILQEVIQQVIGARFRIRAEADAATAAGAGANRRGGNAQPSPASSPVPVAAPPTGPPPAAPGDWPTIAPLGRQSEAESLAPVEASVGSAGTASTTVVAESSRPSAGMSVPAQSHPVVPPPVDDIPLPPEPSEAMYDGFDPGDEPLDDEDERSTRPTDHEADAIALLEQRLGARQIGD